MLDTFKARLKAKTTAAGVNLSKDRITAIADRLHKKFPDLTEEADHDARLDELNELQPFDELAKQDDKLRTLEQKTKEKEKEKEKPDDTEKKPGDVTPKTAEEKFAELEAGFGSLKKQVEEYQARESRQKLNESFQAKLRDKKIPNAFAKRFSVEKEEEVESILAEAENDYKEMFGEVSEKAIGNKDKPLGGSQKTNGKLATKEEVDSVLDKIKI